MSDSSASVKMRSYPDVEIMVRLAHDIRTDAMTLRDLAMSGLPSIMAVVAQHPRTEPDLLHSLSKSPHLRVVMAVAGNPNILPKTAEYLIRYRPCDDVAWLLYSNPATPPYLLPYIVGAYRFFPGWSRYSFHEGVSDNAGKNVDLNYVHLPPSLTPAELKSKIEEIIHKVVHNPFNGHKCSINGSFRHPFTWLNLSRELTFEEAKALLDAADNLGKNNLPARIKVLGLVFRQKDIDHDRLFNESEPLRKTIKEIFDNDFNGDYEALLYSDATYLPYEFITRVINEKALIKRCNKKDYVPLFHFTPTHCIENDKKYFFPHLPPREFGRGGEWRQVLHDNCPQEVRELLFGVLEEVLKSDEKVELANLTRAATDEKFVTRLVEEVSKRDPSELASLIPGLIQSNVNMKYDTVRQMIDMLPDDDEKMLMQYALSRHVLCWADNPVDLNHFLEEGKVPLAAVIKHPAVDWDVFERLLREGLENQKWNCKVDEYMFSDLRNHKHIVQRMINENPAFEGKTIDHLIPTDHAPENSQNSQRDGMGI